MDTKKIYIVLMIGLILFLYWGYYTVDTYYKIKNRLIQEHTNIIYSKNYQYYCIVDGELFGFKNNTPTWYKNGP